MWLSFFEQFTGECPKKENYFSLVLIDFFRAGKLERGVNELKNAGRNQEPERETCSHERLSEARSFCGSHRFGFRPMDKPKGSHLGRDLF
jgi:hypothetical protein